jgi:hypothetical protein
VVASDFASVGRVDIPPKQVDKRPRTEFTGLAGGFCAITSANIPQIEPGTKVV